MRRADLTAAQAKEQFWYVVAECLRVFHHKQAQSVTAAISQMRSNVESLRGQAKELFYHSEPFDVACDIAGKRLEVEDYLSHYLRIRDVEAEKLHRPREDA
jgi:hypothetical protein